MPGTDIWALEDGFWTGGIEHYRKHMAPACLLALPGRGFLQGERVLASIRDTPRWSAVEMTGQHLAETADLAVLGYTASARRGQGDVWRALCTSVYRREAGGGWQLVQHHQSPLGDPA